MSAPAMEGDGDLAAAWDQSWARVKARGGATSDMATQLVLGAFRGDSPFNLIEIVAAADDVGLTADLVQGALRLCAGIARRNRTTVGLMEINASWMHAAESTSPIIQLAARMLLAYQAIEDTANFESIDRLDPGVFHAFGARDFNAVILEAGDTCGIVILKSLAMWRTILPETSALTVKTVATQLWSNE